MTKLPDVTLMSQIARATILWISLMTAGVACPAAPDTEQPVVEMRGDRTLIYPQRMELSGEETLMDILDMYPDLMAAGFDDLLQGGSPFDGWQLRIDNVAVSGDLRLQLTQIKARLVSKVQICDNAGVAKGRNGDGRVIDINLLKAEKGAHGQVSMQGGTDHLLAPSAQLRYGSQHTDLWGTVDYTHSDLRGTVNNAERLHLQMTSRLSPRDRLLSYVTQSSAVSDAGTDGTSQHNRNESFMARFRWFHTFNDAGTELLTLLSWQHKTSPSDVMNVSDQACRRLKQRSNIPMVMLELNTPLPVKGLSMMLGYEGDFDLQRYGISQSPLEDGSAFDEESTFHVINNDIYMQLNYLVGPLRLTAGSRVMFYHYQQKDYGNDWSKNDTRYHFQASAICRLPGGHQLQAAYYRKFRHPSALGLFPAAWPNAAGKLTAGNPLLEETKIDQYKLAYNYGTRRFNASLTGSIYHTDKSDDYWTIGGAAYTRFGILALTGGFDVCRLSMNGTPSTTFADVRLVPVVSLSGGWQASARLVWFSANAPRRAMMDNTAFYGSLQANKQIFDHWDFHLQWHDMFYSKLSALLAGVAWRF